MMSTRRCAATALAALLAVSGCSKDSASPGDRARQAASAAGADQFVRLRVDGQDTYLYFTKGTAPMLASRGKDGKVTVTDKPTVDPLLGTPVALDKLGVGDLAGRMDSVAGSCPKERAAGQSVSTLGGAVVQDVGCGAVGSLEVRKSYLDGRELAPIEKWDAQTLDQAIADVAAVLGDKTQDLQFSTPRAATINPAHELVALSTEQKGPAGSCTISVTRSGAMPTKGAGLLSYGTCGRESPLSDGPFPVSSVTGAKVLAALAEGAKKLHIEVGDIGAFSVFEQEGRLVVQMYVAKGVQAESPIWSEPLG